MPLRPLLLRALAGCLALPAAAALAQPSPNAHPRERDLGLNAYIGGSPGPLDAITDVAGVEVGYTTLVRGSGRLRVGEGPVRTGVTVVFPRGKADLDPVFANWYAFNGNGEMTGTTWVREGGFLEGPVSITNTHSVGVVRDAVIGWEMHPGRLALQPWQLPVVAETWDGILNDINGFHVTPADVLAALDGARGGVVPAEGNVGGGTGMWCFGFKGGTGTASRRLPASQGGYTVGVLVQCNTGARRDLRIAGVPVGEVLRDTLLGCVASRDPSIPITYIRRRCPGYEAPPAGRASGGGGAETEEGLGSIIILVATDAPLLPHQLARIARRVPAGLAREGGFGGNGSGDIFLAFSTANPHAAADTLAAVRALANDRMTPLFVATAQAVEAAITNALLQAEDMTGADDRRAYALPWRRLPAIFARYGRPLDGPMARAAEGGRPGT